MNKTSVVIDGHTVSYWKYQLIDKLYKENNLKKIYITNHKNFYPTFSFVRFFCKNLLTAATKHAIELFMSLAPLPIK